MIDQKQNDPSATAIALGLTDSLEMCPITSKAAPAILPLSTLDVSIRQIKCQQAADIVFDLIKARQQAPNFLETTLSALDPDCKSAFLRQVAKRIEGVK